MSTSNSSRRAAADDTTEYARAAQKPTPPCLPTYLCATMRPDPKTQHLTKTQLTVNAKWWDLAQKLTQLVHHQQI